MALKLVFLGRLEDAAGGPELAVEPAATVGEVLRRLDPELAAALAGERVRVAVNGTLAANRDALTLSDGDEIAFLPPVSGG